MGDVLNKLQPDRTIHLRGFDGRGAAAALHHATENSFKVTGIFRDQSDFAVLMLYDADNFFEHPKLKYLPDFDFSNITLTFDVAYTNLQPLDSSMYATIDWPYLDVVYASSAIPTGRIRLIEPGSATPVAGSYTDASATFVLEGTPTSGDNVGLTLFDEHHTVPVYGDSTLASIVASIRDSINAFSHYCAAIADGAAITVTYKGYQTAVPINPAAPGASGANGNRVGMYGFSSGAGTESWNPPFQRFSGGTSPTAWRVTLAFGPPRFASAQIRQMWLTFAPPTPLATAPQPVEWTATFTNWTVSNTPNRRLYVAGSQSARVTTHDLPPDAFSGTWTTAMGWYTEGLGRRASAAGARVTVDYSCPQTHDLYLGTSLYTDRGIVSVRLDGGAPTQLDCYLDTSSAVFTRRKLLAGVARGRHSVELTLAATRNPSSTGTHFYFDFIEGAVPSDVPEPLVTHAAMMPATDYDTDHSYKLPPQRLLWNLEKLGFRGELNHYVGVFWWNQRSLTGATYQLSKVNFGGSATFSKITTVRIGGAVFDKIHTMGETPATLAIAFAMRINELSAGFWAEAVNGVLTIRGFSPHRDYRAVVAASSTDSTLLLTAGNTNAEIPAGESPVWRIDPSITPPVNRAATDWHADFFAEAKLRNWSCTIAFSMELTDPPDDPANGQVWAARYPTDVPVLTDTGFGTLASTHCAFTSAMVAYQKAVYAHMANLMAAAGLVPTVQFGEFLWWFFTNYQPANPAHKNADPNGGMALYDAETKAVAQNALGRALHVFRTPDDDPAPHAADADFLRGRLRDHIAALIAHLRTTVPQARFEVLFPYDVNHPTPVGSPYKLGGRLNRYINFPAEWEQKQTSGFDRLKIEALAFGASFHNLNLARTAIRFPLDLGWPRDSVRYLLPVFGPGSAWRGEYSEAMGQGIPMAALWAFDHVCLHALDVDGKIVKGRSQAFNT